MALAESNPMTFSLAKLEANAIYKALELTGGNRAAAARILEIHRSTLLRKMRSMGMNDSE
jgi:DNA-binding NtrC family response regulator